MTTLTIFQPEITTLETQLTALQAQLEEVRQADDIASQLLSTLADTLPRFEKLGAIARVKSAVLGLFGGTIAPKLENFVTEVPAAKPTEPTTEEIFNAEVLPEPTEPTVEADATVEQMNQSKYVEQVNLNRTVAYQRRHDGEIICAYIGSANQKLAQNWAGTLELWGCRVEVRKAKRMSAADIKWEVKIWNISAKQLQQVADNHTSPFQSVPAPQTTRLAPEKKNADQPNPSAPAGGEQNAAETPKSEPKQHVALVLGKSDNIYTTYHVQVGDRTIGRVERLSATSEWSVPGVPGTWESKEAAADALIAKREADRKLHQDTNDLLRAKYGLPV